MLNTTTDIFFRRGGEDNLFFSSAGQIQVILLPNAITKQHLFLMVCKVTRLDTWLNLNSVLYDIVLLPKYQGRMD